jgi:hypothetical protein
MAMTIPFEMTSDFLLPFLFIFAVVFGVLNLTNVFKNKSVNAVVSFALAAFAATNTTVVGSIREFFPYAVGFFVILFFFAFTLRLFGLKPAQSFQQEGMIVGAGVLVLLLVVGYQVYELYPVEFPFIGGGENLIFTMGFLMIISIFWGVLKIGEGAQPQQGR